MCLAIGWLVWACLRQVLGTTGRAKIKKRILLRNFNTVSMLWLTMRQIVVVVIGESARSSNFGLLGYERPTTPLLAAEKNLAAFKATSCNTSTKLSLACMFVRPQA